MITRTYFRLALAASFAIAACGGVSPDPGPDAAVDAPEIDAPRFPTCEELGCEIGDLEDPNCTLTGALCSCAAGECVWMP